MARDAIQCRICGEWNGDCECLPCAGGCGRWGTREHMGIVRYDDGTEVFVCPLCWCWTCGGMATECCRPAGLAPPGRAGSVSKVLVFTPREDRKRGDETPHTEEPDGG